MQATFLRKDTLAGDIAVKSLARRQCRLSQINRSYSNLRRHNTTKHAAKRSLFLNAVYQFIIRGNVINKPS